jgi:hypothetical protein
MQLTKIFGSGERPVVHCLNLIDERGTSQPGPLASSTMIDNQPSSEKHQQPAVGGKAKKPYHKPAFRYERVFETQALICGKIVSGLNQACTQQHKTS